MESRIFYNSYSNKWEEGLPIGNGRLAAMIWGDMETDIISLNHEWLWRGQYRYRNSPDVSRHLQEVRRFLKEGDFFKATSLANTYFAGEGSSFAQSYNHMDKYQPAGDVRVVIKNCEEYIKRELDISSAIALTKRICNGTEVSFKSIAHPAYNNIICRWQTDTAAFSAEIDYLRITDEEAQTNASYSEAGIEFVCAFNNSISYKVTVKLNSDGEIKLNSKSIAVDDATYINLYINIGTSVKGIEEELNKYRVPDIDIAEIFESHSKIFQEKLCNVSLTVDKPVSALPTDERLMNIRCGEKDDTMPVLLFNYGRYLLVSSSLSGDLPANLQGKWNNLLSPPWHSDYHFDINFQMNYWMSEVANMSECSERFIEFVESFIPHGLKTAEALYGCRGVYMPLASDAWGRATPESVGFAVWTGAAPWLAQHFWRHYQYNGDLEFLRKRAYPYFAEVSRFFEDYLVKDDNGAYQVMPSQSPENRFKGTGMWPVSIGISSAMDVQLIYDVFSYSIKSAEILGEKSDEVQKWKQFRNNLPKFNIGKDGRLLEWDTEREEVEPAHRHLSHLYGLFPSDIFNHIERPEHYEAAIKSLDYRTDNGSIRNEWSCAWAACLYSRAGQAGKAWHYISRFSSEFTKSNLLGNFPPNTFQIDGSFGIAEAVIQCLLQSFAGKVFLLRALPLCWPDGQLKGFKTVGGHKISFRWSGSKLVEVQVEIGYCGEIILSGLAGEFTLPENASCDKDDIVIKDMPGTVITLKR